MSYDEGPEVQQDGIGAVIDAANVFNTFVGWAEELMVESLFAIQGAQLEAIFGKGGLIEHKYYANESIEARGEDAKKSIDSVKSGAEGAIEKAKTEVLAAIAAAHPSSFCPPIDADSNNPSDQGSSN